MQYLLKCIFAHIYAHLICCVEGYSSALCAGRRGLLQMSKVLKQSIHTHMLHNKHFTSQYGWTLYTRPPSLVTFHVFKPLVLTLSGFSSVILCWSRLFILATLNAFCLSLPVLFIQRLSFPTLRGVAMRRSSLLLTQHAR